ncbi:MAG: AAA family ATPase [Colwellia sp.]
MYLEHFGLTKAPFQIAPDDNFLYLSKKHAKALVYMDYAARQPDGFVVVTGEIGSGKSTLIKRLIRNLKSKVVCFHLPFTNLKGNELLGFMARQANILLSIEDKVAIIYALTDYFKEVTSSGTPCILVIDEAQNLTPENLEEIRMLAALEGPNGTMLRVIMLGQPEFMETINSSEQLRQRVKLHYHLMGLDLEEVKLYIEFRLELSGVTHVKLFDDKLIESIYKLSNGIPRLINKICDSLLICAYSDGRTNPVVEDFQGVAQDLMMPAGSKPSIHVKKSVSVDDGYLSNLDRIATALESINSHLENVSISKKPKRDRKFLGLRVEK